MRRIKVLKIGVLGILASGCGILIAAPAPRPARPSASSHRVWLRTSDGTEFRGTLIDRQGTLAQLRLESGEEVLLPVEEIVQINGQGAAQYFKNFVPAILDETLDAFAFPVGKNSQARFKFFARWESSPQTSGMIFIAPESDPRWGGARFSVTAQVPPKLAEPTLAAALKQLKDGGATVGSESYAVLRGTRTLVTLESNRGGLQSLSYGQIFREGGETGFLRLSLIHKSDDLLKEPVARVLLDKVIQSLRFGPAPTETPAPAKKP